MIEAQKSRRRVKVYKLNDSTGTWGDMGTGYVTIAYSEKFNQLAIFVISDSDHTKILESRVRDRNDYEKQDTLIIWNETSEDNTQRVIDFSISFQDPDGCTEIWEEIVTRVR